MEPTPPSPSSVHVFSMCNGKDFYESVFVINRIDYSVIAGSYSVVISLAQFLGSKGFGAFLK